MSNAGSTGSGQGGSSLASGGTEGSPGEIPLTGGAGGGSSSAGSASVGEAGASMGEAGASMGESTASRPELVAGTALDSSCNSFTRAEGSACGSYYCGVDESTLDQALDPAALCGDEAGNLGGVAFVCESRPVFVVGDCARSERAANLFADNEERRGRIRDCVYQDAEMAANLREPCLDCFIDVALCAGDNCLIQCLAGDSDACDECRFENDCERPLFACSGLPDPF